MGESELILALDQGTSSSRAIVFDARARIRGAGQVELPTAYPRPGWVEQDPAQILSTQVIAARDALAAAGVGAHEIRAIGITNQRETTIAWDADGTPLAPALVWQDRRTADRCADLRSAGAESSVRERTGLLLDPYFSATKMAWLLDALPDGRRRAADGDVRLGTVDTWLVERLTGGRVRATDPSNASRTLLFDLRDRDWSAALGETFGVPLAALPEIRSSDGDFGELDASWLGAPIRVRGILGDQQAALFGQACFGVGDAKNTYGTGCFLLMTTGADVPRPPSGLLATLGWSLGSPARISYALEGSVFVAGAAVRWLRDGLGVISDAASVEPLAASVPDTGGVIVVPAFAGLGAPYWDPGARGAVLGITAGTTAAHLARATLEAIAHQTVDLVDALESGGAPPLRALRADGGAASNDLLLQVQADLLGRPVERPAIAETTALGAALVAGFATGLWSSLDEVAALNRPARVFEPQAPESWRRSMRDGWADAVARVRSREPGSG
ncbi:MAG TPA: glycerol kinase GlpK [Candidatus Limnocylindrales bacterium]